LGLAPPPQIFRDLESPATRGMDSLRVHRSAAPARISTVGGRPIPTDSAAQRRNPPGRNNLVSPRTLASRILAALVRRHHPPHSPARPQAPSGRGGEEARLKDGEAPDPLATDLYRPRPRRLKMNPISPRFPHDMFKIPPFLLTCTQNLVITIRSIRTGLGVCQFGGSETSRV